MAGFHHHWHYLNLSCANIFSSSWLKLSSSIFNSQSKNIVFGFPHHFFPCIRPPFSVMNHVWVCDLTISSVDFWECPLFLFLCQPFAILFICFALRLYFYLLTITSVYLSVLRCRFGRCTRADNPRWRQPCQSASPVSARSCPSPWTNASALPFPAVDGSNDQTSFGSWSHICLHFPWVGCILFRLTTASNVFWYTVIIL